MTYKSMNNVECIEYISKLNTYEEYVHAKDNIYRFSNTLGGVLKLKSSNEAQRLYDELLPNTNKICPICNKIELDFLNFFNGYKNTCSKPECQKEYRVQQVILTHANKTSEEKLELKTKISNTLKNKDRTNEFNHITIEFLLDTYKELSLNMSTNDMYEFYNTYKQSTNHINKVFELVFKCTKEDLYIKLNGTTYCSVCGEKAKFTNLNTGYKLTCIKRECITSSTNLNKGINGVNYNRFEEYIDEKYLLNLYPNLSINNTLDEIKDFCETNSYQHRHLIIAGKIFWGCNNIKELYNKIYSSYNCENCGEEAKFNSFGKGYDKTCNSKICIDAVSYNTKLILGSHIPTQENLDKRINTCIEKYGVSSYNKTEESKIRRAVYIAEVVVPNVLYKFSVNNPELNIIKYSSIKDEKIIECKKCNTIFTINKNRSINVRLVKCPICYPDNSTEQSIRDFITELGVNNYKTKKIIYPKELDIYIPDYNFAIEYNGLTFHSDGSEETTVFGNTPKDAHINKTISCEEKGIQLFHIFENEWLNATKQNIWKSVIKNKLGLNTRIHTRKCNIKEVSNKDCRDFLDTNHMQGYVNSKYNYGLYYNNELVSLMTFGIPRNNIKGGIKTDYELYRFCTKINYNLPGAASKLLKYFENNHNPESILSYANRRWSQGNLYDNLNFTHLYNTAPDYFYFKYNNLKEVFRREKFQKHKLKDILEIFDSNLTEYQNMINNKYRRFFDSGSRVYIKYY